MRQKVVFKKTGVLFGEVTMEEGFVVVKTEIGTFRLNPKAVVSISPAEVYEVYEHEEDRRRKDNRRRYNSVGEEER